MYLSINAQTPTSCSHPSGGEDVACTTPEIITSLITLASSGAHHPAASPDESSNGGALSDSAYCTMTSHHELTTVSCQQGYGNVNCQAQHYPQQESPDMSSPSYSQCSSPLCSSPPSIQATRTHLIKESLKVTIQSKRFANGQYFQSFDSKMPFADELTPEDEERRRRRRERNKVAATKCRNKKKERTVHLMVESENLEQTNITLRSEIQRLENEKQRLLDMLSYHMPACSMQSSSNQGLHYASMNNSCSIMGL